MINTGSRRNLTGSVNEEIPAAISDVYAVVLMRAAGSRETALLL